jgi:hypothetical protein
MQTRAIMGINGTFRDPSIHHMSLQPCALPLGRSYEAVEQRFSTAAEQGFETHVEQVIAMAPTEPNARMV